MTNPLTLTLSPAASICCLMLFLISVTLNAQTNDSVNELPSGQPGFIEINKQYKPMYYKLYREKTKMPAHESSGHRLAGEFLTIYEKYGVVFVGEWINADDPHEQVFMTGFRDETHYREFVEKIRSDKHYQEMSEELMKDRVSIEVVTLKPAFD
jgi:hypothetical protein